jgi:hypothetical protein
MRSNDTRREGFRETILDGNFRGLFTTDLGEKILLPLLQLLRDSETRWSSTYNMILRYLQLYPVRILSIDCSFGLYTESYLGCPPLL